MVLCPRHLTAPLPSRATSANVDVRERTAWAAGVIKADTANEVGILALHALNRGQNHTRIRKTYASVAVQVIHSAVAVVVDNDVGSIAELVPAVASPSALVAKCEVVLRRPEA